MKKNMGMMRMNKRMKEILKKSRKKRGKKSDHIFCNEIAAFVTRKFIVEGGINDLLAHRIQHPSRWGKWAA